jgi:phenylacetate-CoA ligase
MGAWIGGVFTYEALKLVASKDEYRLSIITPGINKQEVINSIKQLGKSFDQVIIGAYAPFLKDILDDGMHQGILWSDYDIGFVFSAEAFSETFRDYVLNLTKPKNRLLASLNHYGTVDMGTMAHETPESILIRRSLIENDNLNIIFPEQKRQATFCQYNPELYYFEEEANNLLCTSYSGLPLVRYNLKDYGGIITREEAHKKLAENNIKIDDLIKKNGLEGKIWNLPFVYVYERNDFSVSYYAFLIYPEMIRDALQKPEVSEYITGKFTMFVDYSKSGRQQFHVNVEKHQAVNHKNLEKLVLDTIHKTLLKESSEYREVFQMMGLIVKPHIRLWEYEDPIYFRPGGKQKWVIK